MKSCQLWPLCLPLATLGFTAFFLGLSHWLSGKNTHCFIHSSTGLHCPGCGGTRCAHDLVAGNWLNALSHHTLLVVGVFCFSCLSLYLIVRITILGRPAPKLPNIPTYWIWIGIGIIALFTVFRNIPAWPFSLLAP